MSKKAKDNLYDAELAFYEKIFKKMRFFVDENDFQVAYVEFQDKKNNRFTSVNDDYFKAYVRTRVRQRFETTMVCPHEGVMRGFVDEALLDGRTIHPYTRIAGNADETVYFLADEQNRVVHVSKAGARVCSNVDGYKFIKKYDTEVQVAPKYSDKSLIDILRPLVNLDEHQLILFAVNLVQQFIGQNSHFLCIVSSEKGTGKSTFTDFWRKIVDPAKALKTAVPSNVNELANHLANHYFVCFDNAQPFRQNVADLLCGSVTGTCVSKRKLYTDSDEVMLRLHNIVILNGINIVPRQQDLLDRSLLFQLQPIPAKKRLSEAELRQKFDAAIPYILGAIFKLLSQYFRVKGSIKVKGSHRMFGAYSDCFVIAHILGVEDEFCVAFQENQKLLAESYYSNDPLLDSLINFLNLREEGEITTKVATLYGELSALNRSAKLPGSASALSRELKERADILLRMGYTLSFTKQREATYIHIGKVRK